MQVRRQICRCAGEDDVENNFSIACRLHLPCKRAHAPNAAPPPSKWCHVQEFLHLERKSSRAERPRARQEGSESQSTAPATKCTSMCTKCCTCHAKVVPCAGNAPPVCSDFWIGCASTNSFDIAVFVCFLRYRFNLKLACRCTIFDLVVGCCVLFLLCCFLPG